mmetsp:Transcript_75455/g.125809  ORF Transcript_75455/g.125809 Transcript_75455/m.125809 type:complete len:308 (-) Transcript_75455:216-1139(-)|eukprot:CAMPEP_0119330532 /NCGR_PEP_ID=MMETSP1333-20130426/78444_1 /TAXON_ID=418940 /ORGANISM="Scyphosphaera apsteinii, Strain RCC1455" /LENGTH=307 /DNA_ID=CAMNT_0007339929 /DNA_START=68 /DNA_END=991 /DNA_ORIENTATION=+
MAFTQETIRAAFEHFDLNKDGFISVDEFIAIMTRVGEGCNPISEEKARQAFKDCDINGDGKVEYDEFAATWANPKMQGIIGAPAPPAPTPPPAPPSSMLKQKSMSKFGIESNEYDEMRRDFNEMDVDQDGRVSIEEVRQALTKERDGNAPSEKELASVMAGFDVNKDGKVTFNEYVAAMCGGDPEPDEDAISEPAPAAASLPPSTAAVTAGSGACCAPPPPVSLHKQQSMKTFDIEYDEYDELRKDFDAVDANGSGTLDVDEVRKLLSQERNGTAPTETELAAMMSSLDLDGDGQVTFDEYIKALCT